MSHGDTNHVIVVLGVVQTFSRKFQDPSPSPGQDGLGGPKGGDGGDDDEKGAAWLIPNWKWGLPRIYVAQLPAQPHPAGLVFHSFRFDEYLRHFEATVCCQTFL